MYSIRLVILKIFNVFIKVYFMKLEAYLALRLAFCKLRYVLETIVLPIVVAYSNESFLTVSSAGF